MQVIFTIIVIIIFQLFCKVKAVMKLYYDEVIISLLQL